MAKTKQPQPTQPQIDAETIRAKRQGTSGGNFIPNSIPQAWGLGVQKYLLPLLAQGIQDWIGNYKERGANNARIIQQVRDKGIDSLSKADLEQFNRIKHRYGDEFNPPSTPEVTPKLLGDVPENPTGSQLEIDAWNEWNKRFPSDVSQGSNVVQPFARDADSLANFGQENADALIQNLGRNPEFLNEEELRKQLFGSGWF